MLCSQQQSEVYKNVKWLLNFSRKNQGLKIFGKVNGQMPNCGPMRLPSTVKILRRITWGVIMFPATAKGAGAGDTKSRPQKTPGLYADPPLSIWWAEA